MIGTAGIVLIGAAGCDRVPDSPSVVVVALPVLDSVTGLREPHAALDPTRPDRLIVAAQYGPGYNRGGRRIWTWSSADGGRTWSGADMPVPGAATVLAADPVTAFGTDGRAMVAFLYADSGFRGGAALTRSDPATLDLGPAHRVVADRLDHGGGAVDKDWLAVDRSPVSPFLGTVYLSWHFNRPLPDHQVESSLWVAASRDQGSTWSEPSRVTGHFGGQIATASNGALEAVLQADSSAILHTTSADGGRSFDAVDTVARRSAGGSVDLPTLAVLPGDTLLVCWAEPDSTPDTGIRCGRGWNGSWKMAARFPAGGARGLPAVAVGLTAVWLLAYQADSAATRVELWRSGDGGRRFTRHSVLAERPFGRAFVCLAGGGPCRSDPKRFFPGDYVGLAAGADRVLAAFTLPAGPDPAGPTQIYAAVVRP